jgi:hypothetical protein
MTTEMWIIAVVRLLGALPVLRWPFYGGVFALLVDQSDLFIMNLVHAGGVDDYQAFDKYLDQAYLLTFLIVAQRWQGWPRLIANILYAYRLLGFIAFEATGDRDVLLFFPNLFEFWFLLIAAIDQFNLRRRLRARTLAPVLSALLALKLFQEYAIHYARWLDSFTAVEAVEAIWHWFTGPLT